MVRITVVARPRRRTGGGGLSVAQKRQIAERNKERLARELASRGGTKTISVGGRTFRASGGRIVSETQFKTIQKQQVQVRAKQEAIKKTQERARREDISRRIRRQKILRGKIRIRPPRRPTRKTQRIKQQISQQVLQAPQRIQIKREQLRQERLTIIKKKGVKGLFDPRVKKIDKKLKELTFAQSTIEFGIGVALLPSAIKGLIRNPKNIKKIPSNLRKALIEEGKETGKLLLTSPGEGIIKIGTEIFLFKGTGKALKLTGKVSSKIATRVSPKFVKLKSSKLTIPSKQIGKTITLEISKPIKKVRVPIKEQVKLAGRETTAVSAQADRLVNFIRTKRVIRKPIQGESKLKSQTRKLLDRFDKGKITKKQIISLDSRIKLETKGAGSLLERSFFASPKRKLRVSRLGKESPDATLLDIIKGDVTFRSQKPQILIFEKVRIQKFPKGLKNIKNKLKTGKTLTQSEANKLLQFQLKKSGKFKPVGKLSKESEITLSPNEIIRKVKTIAVTEFKGRRIPIIRAEVVKAKPTTSKLLKKAREGKITTKELKKLKSNLLKETGFKTSLSRRIGRPKPRVRFPKGIPRIRRRRPPRGRPRPTPRGRPAKPFVFRSKKRKRRRAFKRKPKKPQAWNVFARPLKRRKGQKRPKLIKVNLKPLSKQRAKDLRNYITDTSLSRTARIKPTSGKSRQPRLKVPTGYSRRTSKKFRRHRRVKGRRVALPKGKVIERRRNLLDTRQEKRQITLRRRIKQISPKKKRSSKRKNIKRRKSFKRRRR